MKTETIDGDAVIDQALSQRFEELGLSKEETKQVLQKKQWKEDIYVYRHIIKRKLWESDTSCSHVEAFLKLSIALDGIHRRNEAIDTLRQAHIAWPNEEKFALALAKLLFRNDDMSEAFAILKTQILDKPTLVQPEIAEDAFYLAGWIKIHADDHTQAYKIWSEGHHQLPSSRLLERQHKKRRCWDTKWNPSDNNKTNLVGSGYHGDGHFEYERDIVSFKVRHGTRALSLFNAKTQRQCLVFRSRHPLLTEEECRNVILEVDRYHKEKYDGKWGTVRKSSVNTTDVAVEDIPVLRNWLLELLHSRLYPMLSCTFPQLRDGSSIIDSGTGRCRMRVHDAFIVRYDKDDGSTLLPGHCDTSTMSFSIALNKKEEYNGGGTWFQALGNTLHGDTLSCEIGEAIAFAGPLRHGGQEITAGTRIILVLFLYVEDFPYGVYLNETSEPTGDETEENVKETEGYVVYKQTVDLVNVLEKTLVEQ